MPGPPPVAPNWTFYLSQPTGQNIGALQAARSRTLSFALDGAATCAFTMPGDHPETASIVELAVDVAVGRNGVPLFRGRVGGATDTLSADTITSAFTAVDYRGMLDRRIMWTGVTRSWRGADQADIAWQMIADTQGLPGGALGITRGNAPQTGVLRDRDYDAGKALGEAIAQLGECEGGFEWEIDANRRFNLFYPQRGRSSGEVLSYGRDILEMQRSLTPASFANAVRFNGSQTTTADELTVTTWDPEIGRWDAQASDPNLTLQDTVDERAAYELATASTLSPAFSVTLAEGIWDPAQIWVGDTVQLLVDAGRLNVNTTRRIVQIDITLDDDGAEKVVLSVAAAAAPLTARLTSYNTRINNLERAVSYIPDLPVGAMYDFAGTTPPKLTMWCDGSLLSTVTYPDLYAVIGTTYGGGPGTFNLPDCRGRMTVATGSGPGLTARSAGQTGGAETVVLDGTTTGLHTHTFNVATAGDSATHTHGQTGGNLQDHTHNGNTGADTPAHTHNFLAYVGVGANPNTQATLGQGMNQQSTATSGPVQTHGHPFTTGLVSGPHGHQTGNNDASHTHPVSGTTVAGGQSVAHQNMPPWIAIGKVIKVMSAQNQ